MVTLAISAPSLLCSLFSAKAAASLVACAALLTLTCRLRPLTENPPSSNEPAHLPTHTNYPPPTSSTKVHPTRTAFPPTLCTLSPYLPIFIFNHRLLLLAALYLLEIYITPFLNCLSLPYFAFQPGRPISCRSPSLLLLPPPSAHNSSRRVSWPQLFTNKTGHDSTNPQ